jgi:hypothetical protein
MQIGRITGLSEPQGFSQPDMSTVSFGLLATATEAKQLLDLGSNGAERFVPIVFGTALAANDGVYELLEVGVEADPNMEAAGLRQVSVSARCENRGRQVANSQLLVRGDNRNRAGNVGVTGPLYRAAVPEPATTVTAYNAGPAGFDVEGSALPTLRGDVRRILDRTQVKEAVTVASTANINLATGGTQTVDGVSVSVNGTRVLVRAQTTKSQNGIYTKQTGAWTRATDADGTTELNYAQVGVASGTANGGTTWFNPNVITIGTTAYDWQQAPAFGLRESNRGGPVSFSYQLPLANWYGGACTIEQGGTVVTGTRLAASGAVTIDNGLIRAGFTAAGFELQMASGSPLAWKTARQISFFMESAVAPSIITNTADQVVIRNRMVSTTYPAYRGSIDLAITRGSRTATVSLSFQDTVVAFISVPSPSTLLSPVTAPGYTNAVDGHLVYEDGNDADGNRVGASASLRMAAYVGIPGEAPAGLGTFDRVRAVSFGVHGVVGGGDTLTGADKLYEMDRAWFAMLAQQTSAGVL